MVQRKPVSTPSPREFASPAALRLNPIPFLPPLSTPPSLKASFKSAPADSDNDWDACDDDDEQDLIDLNPSHSAPALISRVQVDHTADPLSPSPNGNRQQPSEQAPPVNATAGLQDSTLAPARPDPNRRRNTNPFLRKPLETQPSINYNLPSHVWDDNMPTDQAAARKAVDPPLVTPRQPAPALQQSPVYAPGTAISNFQVSDGKYSGFPTNTDGPRSTGKNLSVPSPQSQHVASPTQKQLSPQSSTPRDAVGTPQITERTQRNEFYQIKHIRWFDAASKENPRHSPVLVQNANGPCPLLALVNCLVLTTPANLHTALVEALRTREQVSLGLLIDAVFDELMSDRRCGSANELPDVGELYSFLVTLHTGMNVNPRFVPSSDLQRVPSATEDMSPGSFEQTREMRLYGTFSIPLIHGWLPHRNESAFQAFERVAQTYEDVQNAQFREEDLENKFRLNQLSGEDQQLLNDLKTIKQFLIYWPTQLTAHGLDVIDRFLKPGQMAILFRNDHFSSVLKEPYSNRLMTLVTDEGYSTHDEIVWESLVDINGASSEFCSGDFRSVSHGPETQPSHSGSAYDGDGWTTVEGKTSRSKRPASSTKSAGKQPSSPQKLKVPQQQYPPPAAWTEPESSTAFDLPDRSQRVRTASEQEDHDLALALQLQEEEEERQRNEAATRRARENDLSEEFISRESARQGGPVRIPVRRSGQSQTNTNPSYAPPPNPPPSNQPTASSDAGGGDAPPTYEQAAAEAAFHPPRSHPSSEHAPIPSVTSSTQNATAYATTSGQGLRPAPGTTGQRRMSARQTLIEQQSMAESNRRARALDQGINIGGGQASKDSEKCLVM